MMQELSELNILPEDGKTRDIFCEKCPDALTYAYESPSGFIKKMWSRLEDIKDNGTRGRCFEILIATLLYREKILPFFMQVKITFVPNAIFDFMLYDRTIGPVILSAKTSLRERYKQAALEGDALKRVHREAKSYLITLNKKEAETNAQKIKKGEIEGIEKIHVATDPKFDELIKELRELDLEKPGKVEIIKSAGKEVLLS